MRSILITVAILLMASAGYTQTNDWSKRIISKTHRPVASFLNPHVSDVNILIIDGRRFKDVRGLKKFYMTVPGTNSIVFVTDEKDYSVTFHVFNMDTDEDIAIPAHGSVFGQTIGSPKPEDSVKAGDKGKIVLSTRFGPDVITDAIVELDLVRKVIVSKKTFYYDKTGKVIDEYDHIPPF